MVISDRKQNSSDQGSPKIDKPIYITQITGVYTLREEKNWSSSVEDNHHYRMPELDISPFWFDGTGVKVSADEEQITA